MTDTIAAAWAGFKAADLSDVKQYDDVVSGSKRFPVGDHEVVIESVEIGATKTGKPNIKVGIKNGKHDELIWINVEGVDKETGKPVVGFGLRSLMTGVLSDPELRHEFVKQAKVDPRKFQALIGLKFGATFSAPIEGLQIVVKPNGQRAVESIKTGKNVFGETTFATHTDVFNHLKAWNESHTEKVFTARNNIDRYFQLNSVEANNVSLKERLGVTAAPSSVLA